MFYFHAYWEDDPIWLLVQMGWSQQLDKFVQFREYVCLILYDFDICRTLG